MLRRNIKLIYEKRLYTQSSISRNNNLSGFNEDLLQKLQASFKQLVKEKYSKNDSSSEHTENSDFSNDIFAKNKLTKTLTNVYEDPEIKAIDIDAIIKNNSISSKTDIEDLKKMSNIIKKDPIFNNSKGKNFIMDIMKKHMKSSENGNAGKPKRQLKHLPFNNQIFDLKQHEVEIVQKNDVMTKLESFNMENLIYNDDLLENMKFKYGLKKYLASKFSEYNKAEIHKYFKKILASLNKNDKKSKLKPKGSTKATLIESFLNILLGHTEKPPVETKYISAFIRKDLYYLMLSDQRLYNYVSTHNSTEKLDSTTAFIKPIPNLENWIELVIVYDPEKVKPKILSQILNIKNSSIYQYFDDELMFDDLKSSVQSNLYLMKLLEGANKDFTIEHLYDEFKDYLRNGKDYGVMIVNEANKEVLIYTDAALKCHSWATQFLNKKLDELMPIKQGSFKAGMNIDYENLFDVDSATDIENVNHEINNCFKQISEDKDILKFNKSHIYQTQNYTGNDISAFSILTPAIEKTTIDKEDAVEILSSGSEDKIRLDIDTQSDAFIGQKSIVLGKILTNEEMNKTLFYNYFSYIPSLKGALHDQMRLLKQSNKESSALRMLSLETDTCIVSYYPHSVSDKMITLDYGKVIDSKDVFIPPLDILIDVKKISTYKTAKNNIYQLDMDKVTPMLLINQKVNFFKTVPLNYDVKFNQEFVYLLDNEHVTMNGNYEYLIKDKHTDECEFVTGKDMKKHIKSVIDEEFVNAYSSTAEKKFADFNDELDTHTLSEDSDVIKVKLPVKIKLDDKWENDHLMVEYKMNHYKLQISSPVENIHDIKIDKNYLYYNKGLNANNEHYLSYQFEDSENLLEIDTFFKKPEPEE